MSSEQPTLLSPRILLPFALVTLIWGSTWIVIRGQLGVVPATWSVSYRFLVAGIVMAGWALWRRDPWTLGRRGWLFAANVALPVPSDPVAALWHATTLLREHRGDGHVAALVTAGISGRESNVFHIAASAVSEEFMKRSRHYDDNEWEACRQSLADRGLLDSGGALTPDGRGLKDQLETTTDALALRAFDGLDDDELQALFSALTPVARTVIAAGDVPAATPMSARLDF